MSKPINKANMRKYTDIVSNLKTQLINLKSFATENTVRVNRSKFKTDCVDALLTKIDDFMERYGQDGSVSDEYTVPYINDIMAEYREVSTPFNITNTTITPKPGTTITPNK